MVSHLRLDKEAGILIAFLLFLLMIVVFQGRGLLFEIIGRSPRETIEGFKEAVIEKDYKNVRKYTTKDFRIRSQDYITPVSPEEARMQIINFHPRRQIIYDGYTYIMASTDTTITLKRGWSSHLLVWRVKEVEIRK